MAELFLARDTSVSAGEDLMVIKRLLPHMATQSHFEDMFLDEAKLTSRLDHEKIAQTRDFGRHGGQLFIAMEFVDGIDALALLRECAYRKVRLPAEIAVHTAHEILDALDFAHTRVDDSGRPLGVVHRDISPSNVLLSRGGDIKLVDFGIARAAERTYNTKDGTLKGKYGYMSPEQVMDDEVDARSDLFSVGIVLAELLTGRRLFAAQSELDVLLMVRDARLDRLDRFGQHIGLDLDRIVRKALRKRPEDRFASAAEFRDSLSDWLFMHNHVITPQIVGEVVDAFYDQAWHRKRGGPPGVMWRNRDQDGVPELSAGAVEHIEGIPAGRGSAEASDSLPVVSIEDLDSAPVQSLRSMEVSGAIEVPDPDGVVSTDLDWIETIQMASSEYPPHSPRAGGSKPGGTPVEGIAEGDISIALTAIDTAEVSGGTTALSRGSAGEINAPTPVHDEQAAVFASPHPIDQIDLRAGDQADGQAGDQAGDQAAETSAHAKARPAERDHAADACAPQRALPGRAHGSGNAGAGANANGEAGPDPLGEADDVGDFMASPPIAVLYRLAVSRASGLLFARVGGIQKEIYFREGIPEFVSSNVSSELFGAYLVAEGVLSSGELSMALAVMPRYQNRLGDTLVTLDLLTPLEVLRHLTRQVRKKLIDVCTWARGDFAWYAGRENPREAFPLDLDAYEVLGAGAMALPEEHLTDWLHKLGDIRPRMMTQGRVSPEQFQLGALMRDICKALDGSRSLADLRTWFARQKEHDRFVRMLYLLMQTGLSAPA